MNLILLYLGSYVYSSLKKLDVTLVSSVTSVSMSDLNIRDVPGDFLASVKRGAFESQLSIKEFVIRKLSAALGQKAAPVIKQREDPRKKQTIVITKKKATGKQCEQHKKPMKDFGNKWYCEGPPPHSELK